MKAGDAKELGQRVATFVWAGEIWKAHALLAPVLVQRTPFRLLDVIGQTIGAGALDAVNAFLVRIAEHKTEGGWVVIASALGQQLDRDLVGAFDRCRRFVVAGDIWYATDILGERVPGPALLRQFEPALALLTPWREDSNRWVRRTIGIAVHFWAKRTCGKADYSPQAEKVLTFLEPLFEERDMDAVKGVSWGLKTLGRYYPTLVADWLRQQVVERQRPYRSVMLRKALTYLPVEQRARVVGDTSR